MGRKKSETSVELRNLIINHHKNGKSLSEISVIVERSRSTVQYVVKRYKNENRIENLPRNVNRKILSKMDDRYILRQIKQNPKISAPKIASKVKIDLNKDVSAETILRSIRNQGYNGRVARKKPLISEKNRKLRLEFAKNLKNSTFEYWQNVLFTDESKYNVFGSDGRQMVDPSWYGVALQHQELENFISLKL